MGFDPSEFGGLSSAKPVNNNIGTGASSPVSSLDTPQETYDPSEFGSNYVPLGDAGESKYDVNLSRQNVQYKDLFRHQKQSGVAQFGNFLNQAVVGEILGGTLEGIGYLTDVKQYADLAAGTEQEFGNWFSDIGKSVRTWSEEVTPIYQDPNKVGKFSPGEWSWWMANGKSVASTLSLMLPAFGAVKGLSMAGKAIGLTDGLLSMGKAVGMAPETLSWVGTGLSRAVVSRHMENVMESSGTYEESLNDALQSGKSYEEAKEIAAKAASMSYNLNWAALIQDIPEYMILGNFASKASMPLSAKLAKELQLPVTSLLAKKGADVAFDLISEGAEEGYQFIVGEESRALAKHLSNPEATKDTFGDRFSSYLKNGELYTNMFMGALGAGVSMSVANIMGKVNRGETLTPEENRVKQLYDLGAEFTFYNQQLAKAKEDNNEAGVLRAKVGLISTMGRKGAVLGNLEADINFLKNIKDEKYTPEQLEERNMTEENVKTIKEEFSQYEEDLRNFETIYNKYTDPKASKVYKPEHAGILAQNEFIVQKLTENSNLLKDKTSQAEQKVNEELDNLNKKVTADSVSTYAKELLKSDIAIESLVSSIKTLKTRATNPKKYNLSENEVKNLNDRIEQLNTSLKGIREDKRTALKDYNKTQKEIDLQNGIAYPEVKDKVPSYKNYLKASEAEFFGEIELSAAKQELTDNLNRISQLSSDRPATKTKEVEKLYKDLNTDFSKFLETSTRDLDEQTKTVIADLLDKGVSPITLLAGDKLGTLVDDRSIKVFKDINAKLSDSTRNSLNFLLKEFKNKLFFNLTGKVKADVSEEEYNGFIEQVNNNIKQELTKSVEVDLTAEPAFEGEPVTVTKKSKKETEAVVKELTDSTNEEDILDNDLYISPDDLNYSLKNFLTYRDVFKAKYKEVIGRIKSTDKGVIFESEDNKQITITEVDKTLLELGIRPYRHTIFDGTIKGNIITIGKQKFTLPLIKPFDAIQTDKDGNLLSITLNNKVLKHPLFVKELAYVIEVLNNARVEALQLFLHEGEFHGVEVTDLGSKDNKKYLVYYDEGSWIVKDPNEKGVVKLPNTVNKRVLTELFSVLDTIIENDKTLNELNKQEKDELRETFTNVRRPSPKEVNSQPPNPTVSSVKGVKENETKTGDGSEEAGRSVESSIINNTADELASNKAINSLSDVVDVEFGDNPNKDKSSVQTDIITAGEESMERIRARRVMKRQTIFLNHTAVSGLYNYLSNPKNTTVGDRAEFYIDTTFSQFFNDKPGLIDRINRGDKTILDDANLVDNIPINSKYITKEGQELQGYWLPVQGNEKWYEVPNTVEDLADIDKYNEGERAKRNELRYKILAMVLDGKVPVATDLEKNKGVPIKGTTGVVHNVADLLGIKPREVRFGVSRRDHTIRDVDGNKMGENIGSVGNVFVGTNQTCDGSYTTLKCNPIKISREHAEILFDAFRIAATAPQGGNSAYPGVALVNSVVNGKVQSLSVRAVINTLVYQGEDNTKVTEKKGEHLLPKQVYLKDKKLYVGDFEGKKDTGLIIKDFNEADKAKFINYVTSNINYNFPISLMNTPAKYSMTIGKFKIKEGEYYNEVIVNNNLVTIETGKHTKYNIPYHNPYLRINIDSLQESTSTAIPIKTAPAATTKTTDTIVPPVTTTPVDSKDVLKTLKEGDILKRESDSEVRSIGKVINKSGSLYLQLTDKDALTDEDEGLKEFIKLTDEKELNKVYEFYVGQWEGSGLDATFLSDRVSTTSTVSDTEGVLGEEGPTEDIELPTDLDDLNNEFGPAPRISSAKPKYKVIDVEKETKWLKQNLRNVRLDLVDKYIKILTNGRAVHGMFKRNAITLYKAAEEGTGYHEAFHAVSLLYLTEKERTKLYKEAKSKYNMAKSTNKEVNEKLAEEFRKFILSGEDTVEVTNPILRFFKDLLDFIVTFVTGRYHPSDLTIERLFKSIARGKYAYAKPIRTNLMKMSDEEYLSTGLGFSAEETDNVVNYMLYLLVNNNNISTPKDIGNISFDPVANELLRRKAALQNIIKTLNAKATKTAKDEQDLINATQFESIISTVIGNINYFKGILDDRLMSLNIKKRKDVNDDGEEYNEDEGESESAVVEGTKISRINQSTYEFNKANNILANVKLFIATLPNSKATSVHPTTGLPVFEDFKTSWNKLMFDLWQYDNIDDMIEFGISRAKDDIFYKVLIYGITKNNTLIRPGLLNSSELFRTQFYRSLNNFRYNFKAISQYKGKSNANMSYGVSDPFNLGQANALSITWSKNFLTSKVYTENNKLDKVFLSNLLKDYTTIKSSLATDIKNKDSQHLTDYVNSTALLLNKIGISISYSDLAKYLMVESARTGKELDETLNILCNKYGGLNDIFGDSGVISQLLTTGKVKTREDSDSAAPTEYFIKNKNIIKDLAKIVTAENIDSVSSTILGPDNNPYYIYAQNSYVTDFIKAINRGDKELLSELEDDIYLKNSIFFKQIKAGAKLELHTFSAFDNTAYNSLNEEQDFLARFHFMLKGGLMPFPTLADKPTYHMFGGVQGITFRGENGGFVDNTGNYEFPKEVYDIVRGYIKDETNRIAKAKADIQWAKDNNNNSNLVLNYHFTLDKAGKVVYNGNALKYIHFPELNETDGKITDAQIKLHLLNLVKGTMEYADRLGIVKIARFSNGKLNNIINRKLDKGIVEAETKRLTSKWGMYNLLAEYTVNTMISTIESEKLLSGDAAFYKGIEDKIKRLSALIAPGDSLRSHYKTGELAGKTTYNTITLRTPRYSDNEFIKKWQSTFEERVKAKFRETNPGQGELSDEEAKIQAEVLLAPYRNIDAPDGQVFITPAMHREIALRLGEWGDEQDSAFDLLLSDKDLSIEEESKLTAIVMQPLKLVYFGATNRLGLRIPVYDKMSLATLFPRQLREQNSKLLPIYNKMVELNIGMLKFDSAVKAGSPEPINYFKTTYDEKGNPDGYTIDTNVLNTLKLQTQSFKNLKMQQDTRQHDINRVLLATQVRKIIADNTTEVSQYLSQLSDLGLKQLEDRYGITKDGVTDLTKLVKELRAMAVSRNMALDTVEYIKVDEKDPTKLNMNIDCHHDRKWLESRIISMIRKATVDTEVPGNSLIQVTSYGYDNVVKSDLLKLNEETGVTEIIVSISLYKDIVPKDVWAKGYKTTKAWLLKNQDKLEGIAYRIPTQSPNMVVPYVIKDFLPEYASNTVMVPLAFTALTDSDFDVDKLFIFRYNYKTKDDQLVRGDDVFKPGTRHAIENKLLDTYLTYLTNPDNILETRAPLSKYVDDLKVVCKDIQKLEGSVDKKTFMYSLTPYYQHRVRHIYNTAKAGVGPYALATVHHALGRTYGLSLNADLGIGNKTEDGRFTDISQKYGIDGETITNRISSFISGNVDAAKDPYIFYGNINKETWSISALLLRAGYGLDTLYFLAQPILKEVSSKYIDITKIEKNYRNALYEALRTENQKVKLDDYIKRFKGNKTIFNQKSLKDNININTARNAEWYARQLAILDKYKFIKKQAQYLSNTITYSQIDTGGFGNSILTVKSFDNKLQDTLAAGNIQGFDRMFNDTFLKKYYENCIKVIEKTFNNLTLGGTDPFTEMYDVMFNETVDHDNFDKKYIEKLRATIAKELFSSTVSHYFSSTEGLGYTPEQIKRLFIGKNNLPDIINQIKQKPKHPLYNNFLIKNLRPVTPSDKYKDLWYLETVNREDDKYYRDRMKQAWEEMLTSDDESVKKLARALIAYAFYSSGFNRNFYSIYDAIPLAYYHEIPQDLTGMGTHQSYDQYIKELVRDYSSNLVTPDIQSDLIRDVYINNWHNKDIVTQVDSVTDTQSNKPIYREGKEGLASNVPLVFTFNGNPYSLATGRNVLNEMAFKPFVSYNNAQNRKLYLYEYVGYNTSIEDGKEVARPVYKLTNKKGYKDDANHVIKEYGFDDKPSIIEDNNLKMFMTEEKIEKELKTYTGYSNFNYVPKDYRIMSYDTTEEPGEELTESPDQLEESPLIEIPVKTTWARKAENNYEVSSKGDKRFSAFYARLKGVNNRTIEDIYQTDIKGYKTMQEGKGKPAISGIDRKEQWSQYLDLWVQFANENPKLMQELANKANGKVLTDMFANTDINQARALSEILNKFDYYEIKTLENNVEESPFESDLNIDKIKLIPTGISVEDYNQIVSLAKDDNTTIEQFKEFLTHLRECL